MNWKKAYSLQDALENPETTRELYIHKRPMAVFPVAIFQLINLRKLEITACQLKNLPDNIFDLKQLEILVLSNNRLNDLPQSITQLSKLQELDISENAFEKFPRVLLKAKTLERLKLQKNKIKTLPKNIVSLIRLKKLDVSYNSLKTIPDGLTELKNLESLRLTNNRIKELPEGFDNWKHLRKLFLNRNKLLTLPNSIGDCEALQTLNLTSNKLSQLPDTLWQCTDLINLFVNKNQLTHISDRVDRLSLMQTLDASENQLRSIPETIAACHSLQQLELSKNQLSHLPNGICQLSNLSILNLDANELQHLPTDFNQLKNLRELSLSRNPMTELPDVLLKLPLLSKLRLPTSMKAHRGLANFFKKCIKAALPEKDYDLFYQLSMGEKSLIDELTETQLLYALRFPDVTIQQWAQTSFLEKYSKPLELNRLQANTEIVLLGRTKFKKSDLKTALKKKNIRYVLKATSETTHVVLGAGPFVEKSLLSYPIVYITEEVLSNYLRDNSEQYLLDAQEEIIQPVAALLLSSVEANIQLALQMLQSGGVPTALLTELFIVSRSDVRAGLQQQARSLLELNANSKTRAALRQRLSLKGVSRETILERIRKYTTDTELEEEKLELWAFEP